MGSSRFIYDLLNNKWPDTGSDTSSKIFGRLTIGNIKQYIELGQFVNENPSGKTDEDIIGVLHEQRKRNHPEFTYDSLKDDIVATGGEMSGVKVEGQTGNLLPESS